ncbi:hypothetical protein LTR85_006999 [Meristemomyces frigidus]|nr:hypothetical protein LTR85_006999 [Meristemomyces frigidus]
MACLNLLKILQAPANRNGIRRRDSTSDGEEQHHTATTFPFIATCLTVGASLHKEHNHSAKIHPLPLETSYDGCANDDGISVYDITDPAKPRYGFVFLEDRQEADARTEDNGAASDDEGATSEGESAMSEDAFAAAKSVIDGRTYLDIYYTLEEQRERNAMAVVEGASHGSQRKHLTLALPDLLTWTAEDVKTVLAIGSIEALHIGDTPMVPLRTLMRLVAAAPNIQTFTCAALFSRALQLADQPSAEIETKRGLEYLAAGKSTPFPLAQAIYLRQYDLDDAERTLPRLGDGGIAWSQRPADMPPGHGDKICYTDAGLNIVPMPLRDALLSPERICRDLPKMLRGLLAVGDFSFNFYEMSPIGAGLATQLAINEGHTVRPIPGELYAEYTRFGRSSTEGPLPVRDLRFGEWTLLLIHDKPKPIGTKRTHYGEAVDAVRYAFVTVDEYGEVQALSADDFFSNVMAESVKGARQQEVTSQSAAWCRNLQQHADGTLANGPHKSPLSPCTPEEAQEAFAFLKRYNAAIEEHDKSPMIIAWRQRGR